MNPPNFATKTDLQEMTETIIGSIDSIYEKIDSRFENIDTRLGRIEGEIASIKSELSKINDKLDILDKRTSEDSEGAFKDIDSLRKELRQAVARIAKLEAKQSNST